MGVDTKAIIHGNVKIQKIEEHLSEKFKKVTLISNVNGFFQFFFKDGKDRRTMSLLISSKRSDENIRGHLVFLSYWGNSVEILKGLCEKFGGFLDENDCDEEGFYPVNLHLYKEEGLSKRDLF